MARCGRCRILKPLDNFGVDRSRRSGRSYVCRPCGSAAAYARKVARKRRFAVPEPIDQARAVPGACIACQGGLHGHDCRRNGCGCRCRPMLGLDGPFPDDAPDVLDMLDLDG
jgi:hypothetical protein